MDVSFATKKLEKQMNAHAEMVKAFGPASAKRLGVLLTALRAAPTLAVFAPPMSPPHRCHELTGNLQGHLSLDLAQVTAVEVVSVEDTHG